MKRESGAPATSEKFRSCTRSCKSLNIFEITFATASLPIAIGTRWEGLKKMDKPEDLPIIHHSFRDRSEVVLKLNHSLKFHFTTREVNRNRRKFMAVNF